MDPSYKGSYKGSYKECQMEHWISKQNTSTGYGETTTPKPGEKVGRPSRSPRATFRGERDSGAPFSLSIALRFPESENAGRRSQVF